MGEASDANTSMGISGRDKEMSEIMLSGEDKEHSKGTVYSCEARSTEVVKLQKNFHV